MSNFTKKIVAIATALSVAAMVAGPAAAQSVSDLQAQIAALTAQLAQLTAQLNTLQGGTTTTTSGITGCTITSFTQNLSQGSSGNDVKCLQIVLNSSADTQVAASGAGSPGNETTYFGALTKAAVVKFQNKYAAEVLTPVGLTAGTGYVGPSTRAELNTLLAGTTSGGTTGGTTPVTNATPLSVTLDPSSPASSNIVTGSANNTVAIFDLTGSATADTQVTSLTINSYGTVNPNTATDVSGIKVFNGNDQVGLTQTLIAGQTTFVFAPAITIPAGTTKALKVTADIPSGGTTLATVKLGIAAASSIGGATFSGNFPVVGNTFSIVPGGTLGSMSVTAGTVVPQSSVKVGATNVVLGNFTVSAGTTEDINVTQFNVLATSTALDTDVTNVRVLVDGVLQGNSATFSLRRATINFSPGILITKGTSRTFQVIGDVASGVGRDIEIGVQANGVLANGVSTGVGIAGPSATFYLGLPNDITIGQGALSVSIDSASPQGSAAVMDKSTTPQTLGILDLRANGENTLVTNAYLTFAGTGGATGTISSVGLYDSNGALLSNLQTLAGNGTNWGTAVPFTMSWTVPANTTEQLYIKGVTNGITAPDPAYITPSLDTTNSTGNSIIATGLSSGGLEGAGNITSDSQLALPTITVYSGPSFAIQGDALVTPRNQAILAPVSQAAVSSIQVTAIRENQTLRSITLTCNTTGANCAQYFSSVALYDQNGNQLTDTVTPNATSVVFTNSDIISNVSFQAGVPVTLKIVGSVLSTASGTSSWAVGASDMETSGVTSGAVAYNSAASLAVNSAGLGTGTGGVLTAEPNVLEMKVDAQSPAGTIARGNFAPVAKWDLIARGSDIAGLNVTNLVFYGKTGLAGLDASDTALVRLYNENTQAVVTATATIDPTAGTITFAIPSGDLQVSQVTPTVLDLQITTTDTTIFPANTTMQFTVNTADGVTAAGVTGGAGAGIGYGGTTWSVPTDAYSVSLSS